MAHFQFSGLCANQNGFDRSHSPRVAMNYGFTIVELLIVIVVIGILAAISIVSYNGIQNRANNIAVEQDLTSLVKKFELFKVDYDRYPISANELATLNFKASKSAYHADAPHTSNLVVCQRNTGMEYTVTAISKSGKKYYVSNSSKAMEYTGTGTWPSYVTMCSTTLPGSTVASGASSGYSNGVWRPWVE